MRNALGVILLLVSGPAAAATWTLHNVTTAGGGSWTGTFNYDATTNTYSSINIVSSVINFPNPVDTVSTDGVQSWDCVHPPTASGVTLGPDATGWIIFCMDFATPLTNAGGTVNLVTGDVGWATFPTSGLITGGSVTSPLMWTLQNVTTEGGVSWTGTFKYDATTNTYSEINIVSGVVNFPNPVDTVSTDSVQPWDCVHPATANGVTLGPDASGSVIFCLDFATPLTNAGGTINLVTGDVGWAGFFVSGKITSGSVTAAALPTVNVAIDIQPGQTSNTIHTNHNNVNVSPNLDDLIEVGVLGAMTSVGDPVNFNTSTIDPATLKFGPGAGSIAPGTTPLFNQNVDNDGIADAKFQFRTSASGITCGQTSATLTGKTTSGQPFTGTDTITTQCNATCH